VLHRDTLARVRRAGLIAAGVAGVVALAGLGAWLALFRDTAEPVSVGEAVTSFRTETEPATIRPSPIPVGVYAYGTDGFEQTDALTGVTHRYPRVSTITVTVTECGVSLTWRVLKGRSTKWMLCVDRDGWELASQDERHTFFGRTEMTIYTCRDTAIRPLGRPVGFRWRVSCSTDDAREAGTARIVRHGHWWRDPDGSPSRPAVLVRKSTVLTGAIRGSARYDFWFDVQTGVPIAIDMVSRTTNDSPVGDVHYEEDVTLRLLSLEPRR
jgi:hypothetical protein